MKFRRLIERLTSKSNWKPKLHFVHVGKTGGSAIAFALKGHTKKHIYNIRFQGHKTKLKDIPVGEKLFFCVRDPIDRFVSGFFPDKGKEGRNTIRHGVKRKKLLLGISKRLMNWHSLFRVTTIHVRLKQNLLCILSRM